jgi:hypothetical protein
MGMLYAAIAATVHPCAQWSIEPTRQPQPGIATSAASNRAGDIEMLTK